MGQGITSWKIGVFRIYGGKLELGLGITMWSREKEALQQSLAREFEIKELGRLK